MDKSIITTGTIVTLVIGLIIGFALGAYTYGGKTTSKIDVDSLLDNRPATTSDGILGSDSIPVMQDEETSAATDVLVEVTNQVAGTRVIVDEVKADAVSWVAIRDWSAGGFGNILGAKRVDAGVSSLATVELLRGTQAGRTYAAVLYRDDGDRVFNHKLDRLLETNGRVVAAVFDVN